jgi:hypothetical protein
VVEQGFIQTYLAYPKIHWFNQTWQWKIPYTWRHGGLKGLIGKPSINCGLIFGAWMSVFHSSPQKIAKRGHTTHERKGVETISSKILKNP